MFILLSHNHSKMKEKMDLIKKLLTVNRDKIVQPHNPHTQFLKHPLFKLASNKSKPIATLPLLLFPDLLRKRVYPP